LINFACIGAAHIDTKVRAAEGLIVGTSNPVTTSKAYGGVARNIAENLAKLGASCTLVSRVGQDPQGDQLIDAMQACAIDTSLISRSQMSPTATYTAILHVNGDLMLGLADMAIYDELTPALISSISHIPYWIVDGNVSEACLRHLGDLKPKNTSLWVIPVSIPKVHRLRTVLTHIDGLIINVQELAALLSQQEIDIPDACTFLHDAGVSMVVVTRGSEGVFVSTRTSSKFFEAYATEIVDVTGAGDAFSAGMLYGLHKGLTETEAVHYGLAAASLNLKTHESVHPNLSLKLLLEEITNSNSSTEMLL